MLVHFFLITDSVRHWSPTLDEVGHLPAGLSYLEKRTFRMYRHNPPLARLLPACAAMTANPKMHYAGTWEQHDPPSPWLFGLGFLAANSRETFFSAIDRGRLVIAIWSALTIPILFLWGRWWFGAPSGWLATLLWTLCPNLIAHGGLITTDVAATSMGLLTSYTFARWLDRPLWGRCIFFAILFALAQLTKFSLLWLGIVLPLWGIGHWLGRRRADIPAQRNIPAQIGVMVACILGIINAGYLGEGTLQPLGDFELYSVTLTRPRLAADGPPKPTSNALLNEAAADRVNRFRGSLLGWIPCPLPYHYVAGFDEQKFESEGRYSMYLAGELREGGEASDTTRSGWWYYYLYALGVKLPLSTWLLLGMSIAGVIVSPLAHASRLVPLWMLALTPIVTMSFLTDINLGFRYILPALPMLFLIAGTSLQTGRPRFWNVIVVLAVVWNGLAVLKVHPHELSYFHELAGGPTAGRFHLIDSNLDWGQDLRGLATWLKQHPDWDREVRIAYMGSVPPEYEGIGRYRLAPRDLRFVPPDQRLPWENPADPSSNGPQPGKYAISVNFERGMQNYMPCPLEQLPSLLQRRSGALVPGTAMLYSPAHAYEYFQHWTPEIFAEVGYSILLYDVSREEANQVRRKIGLAPLPEQPTGIPTESSRSANDVPAIER